jgi:hypothetical protein
MQKPHEPSICAAQLRRAPAEWRTRALTFGASALVAMLGALAAPSAGAAELNIKWYSFRDQACTQRVDPVTTIFFYNAHQEWVNRHIPHHNVFVLDVQFEGIAEPLQNFWDAGYCTAQWGAWASAYANADSRFHVRFRDGHYTDPTFWTFSIATPHKELRRDCGHAVIATNSSGWSGFDEGRLKLATQMSTSGGHYSYYKYVGNSAQMTQCDGTVAGSNGQARYIRIDTEFGPT